MELSPSLSIGILICRSFRRDLRKYFTQCTPNLLNSLQVLVVATDLESNLKLLYMEVTPTEFNRTSGQEREKDCGSKWGGVTESVIF